MSLTRRLTIITKEIDPPILRSKLQWKAYAEPRKQGDPVGYGTRESEAVMDLYEAIADREQADEDRYLEQNGD